jgi:hypothetical protein
VGRTTPAEFGAHVLDGKTTEVLSSRLSEPSGEANGDGHPGESISGRVNATPASFARSFGQEACCELETTPSLANPIEMLVPIATYLLISAPDSLGLVPVSTFSHPAAAMIAPSIRILFMANGTATWLPECALAPVAYRKGVLLLLYSTHKSAVKVSDDPSH